MKIMQNDAPYIDLQVPQVGKIFANDNSPDAFRCLWKNVEESKASLAGCEVKVLTSCEDAATLLTDLASQKEVKSLLSLMFFYQTERNT